MIRFPALRGLCPALLAALLVSIPAGRGAAAAACTEEGEVLTLGFYAYFAPMSSSADPDPEAPGFHTHLGYEADLVTALEAIAGAGLSFSRHPIAEWDDIWLKSASEFDVVGGGITILADRTRDSDGVERVRFTDGHVAFRQSLLVRGEDAGRFASYRALDDTVRVGALAGTTGEARLLQIVGIADGDGVLAAGTRVVTAAGELVADGSGDYVITAARSSPALDGRRHLYPAAPGAPQLVYLGDEKGEAELLEALATGAIDALARGEIGNRTAAHGGDFALPVLDEAVEWGGFTLAAERARLAGCISRHIDWLTDGRRIGYGEWLADPDVFMKRAAAR